MGLRIDGKRKSFPFVEEEIAVMLAMYEHHSTPKQICIVLAAKGYDREVNSIREFLFKRFGHKNVGMQPSDETLRKIREMYQRYGSTKVLAVHTGLECRTIRHILSDVSNKVQARTVKMVAAAYERMLALDKRERQGDKSAAS